MYEVVFRRTTRIERLLTERGGEGSGLMSKAERIRYALPSHIWMELEWISQERNRVAHQENATLDDPEEFERSARKVIQAIERIPVDHDQNLIGWLRRAFSDGRRRPRSRAPLGLQVIAFVVVAGIVLYMMSEHREKSRQFEEQFNERRRQFEEQFNNHERQFGARFGSDGEQPSVVHGSVTSIPKPRPKRTKASAPKRVADEPARADDTTEPANLNDDANAVGANEANDAGSNEAKAKADGGIKMTPQELDAF